jgi:hypothetical protein
MNTESEILVALSEHFVARVQGMPKRPILPFLRDERYLLCSRVETREPNYLRVWAKVAGDESRICEIQLPHSAVEFLWLSVPNKPIGFWTSSEKQ